MRVLVTGGAGYVGSHAVRQLVRAGHEVWVYDNLSQGHRGAVDATRLIVGELNDPAHLSEIFRTKRIEAVMHFAAFTLVGESVTDPAKYYFNNVVATLSLLDTMRKCDVNKIVFSSTTAIYGEPQRIPISEDEPWLPINPYGYAKAVIERVLSDYAHAYGLGYAALRYFNAAGASPEGDIGEDHQPESHLIPLVMQAALAQRPHIAVFGDDYPTPDGTCLRDYIHVDDLASAHLAALAQLAPGVKLQLNLGTGRGHSVREVIDACRAVSGREIAVVMAPRRPGDAPALVADSRRAQAQLAWQPRYTELREIVETAWRWHSRHPQGYGDR